MKAKQMLRCAMVLCLCSQYAYISQASFNIDDVNTVLFEDFEDMDYKVNMQDAQPLWHERIKSYLATLWINYRKWVS